MLAMVVAVMILLLFRLRSNLLNYATSHHDGKVQILEMENGEREEKGVGEGQTKPSSTKDQSPNLPTEG